MGADPDPALRPHPDLRKFKPACLSKANCIFELKISNFTRFFFLIFMMAE